MQHTQHEAYDIIRVAHRIKKGNNNKLEQGGESRKNAAEMKYNQYYLLPLSLCRIKVILL